MFIFIGTYTKDARYLNRLGVEWISRVYTIVSIDSSDRI